MQTIYRFVWRWLVHRLANQATRAYGGPGERGELFNTANFQGAVGRLTGQTIGEQTARMWLVNAGYTPLDGGCHWIRGDAS
jgi:hypothetical protein